MYLLGLGMIFLAMKFFGWGMVAAWDWWFVVAPFGLAVLWWAWADWSGYTKKKVMKQEDARRQHRVDMNRQALGSSSKKKRR